MKSRTACLLAGLFFSCGSSFERQEPLDVLPRVTMWATLSDSQKVGLSGPGGRVLIDARIDSIGRPTKAEVDGSDDEGLDSAAIDIVTRSHFTPAFRGGEPVSAWVFVLTRFVKSGQDIDMRCDGIVDPTDTTRFKPPEIVKKVTPVYPRSAINLEVEGRVIVKLAVDRKGNVTQVEIVKSSQGIFEKPALDAARQFVFKPAQCDGMPIPVTVAFPFRFKLAEPPGLLLRPTH